MTTNPFLTALWIIATAGLLVGFIASVADFGYGSDRAAQAVIASSALGLGGLSLIGGLIAAAITWRPDSKD